MSNTKKGLRALGLSFLAVLGFMAFAAAGAQGQTFGMFLDTGGELAVNTTFKAKQESNGTLLVSKLKMGIECTETEIVAGTGVIATKLAAGPPHTPGTAHATIRFLNCIVRTDALSLLGNCEVEGKLVEAQVKFLAMLAKVEHGSEPYILAEPLTAGQPFATIKIIGKFCSLSGTYEAKGTLALQVLAGLKKEQLVKAFPTQSLLGDELLLGTNPASLDGSATLELTGPGALAGAEFGVC